MSIDSKPASSPSLRIWLLSAAGYIALTLVYARTLLPVVGSALPNDTGDPGLNAWILWWNAHSVPLTARWWNGPIFYPAEGTMALSETFLNLLPLSSPMQWAGMSAVLTYNVLFLLSFPAAALAAHALAYRLAGRHDAGLIAGLAYGFAPYRAAQMPHLQTLWSCWMPLALFALHGYVRRRRVRDLVLFACCWTMNGLATGYFLFFFGTLAGLWVVWFARTWRQWLAITAAAVVASLPLVPLLLGYRHYQQSFGLARSLEEIETFSADLSSIWATTPYVWPHLWTFAPRPEGELYPGATIIVLTIVGAVVVWRRWRPARRYRAQPWLFGLSGVLAVSTYLSWKAGGWTLRIAGIAISATRPAKALFTTLCLVALALFWNPRIVGAWRRRSVFLFYSAASVLMLVFALGPVGHLFNARFLYQAPYYWLMQLPGGHAFRVPSRFAMLFILCLAQAAALAYVRLTSRGGRAAVTALICVAVAAEGFVAEMGVAPVAPPLDLAGLDRGAVLLEMPIVDTYTDTAAMLRATQTGHVLVNGFSGYIPPHYDILYDGLMALDDSLISALQEYGPLLVFVRQDKDPDGKYRDFIGDISGVQRVLATPAGTLFHLPPRSPAPIPPREVDVPVAGIRPSKGTQVGAAVTDGDLETRWHTITHQTAGDSVTIDLQRSATISRLELDLGPYRHDYPRKLEIAVIDDDGKAVEVWDGRTTGLAMLATLHDRERMPLTFALSRFVRGRQIRLTILDGHPEFAWSIAELKVFGS